MSSKSRIEAIERAVGYRSGEVCACGRVRVSVADGWRGNMGDEIDGPEICPRCGLPVPVVRVEFVELATWRAEGSPHK